MISWIVSIPQDIVKTKQMTHMGTEPLRAREAISQLVREGGVRRIFRGTGPTLARGYLTNMITLPLFDALSEKLRE